MQELQEEKKCIVCEEKSGEFYIRGLPNICYCRECALEKFKDLEYLEQVTTPK